MASSTRRRLSTDYFTPHGVSVMDMESAVVSAALLNPDRLGFVAACEGLRVLSRFSRRHMDASHAREERVRQALLDTLAQTSPGSRNRRKAEWLLQHADGACESVAEQLLLFILRRGNVSGLRTQHQVAHALGNSSLDIAIPQRMLCLEFDGRIKYRGPDWDSVRFDEALREQALRELGWIIIRFAWRDLSRPESVLARVRGAMSSRAA